MPVRVFTYLIGKDDSNAADMNWIACNNKGIFFNFTYYSYLLLGTYDILNQNLNINLQKY